MDCRQDRLCTIRHLQFVENPADMYGRYFRDSQAPEISRLLIPALQLQDVALPIGKVITRDPR